MITLSVFKRGAATYETAISQQFNPTQILKMVATKFGADTSCCLFEYEQQAVVVAQSVNQVSTAMIAAGFPCFGIGEAREGEITLPFNVIFLTQAVQYVENIGGYPAATYGTPNGYKATSTAFGQSSTVPFQVCSPSLQASLFVRKDRVLSDGTTRDIYINPNAIATITGDNYVLPSGNIIETSVATYVQYRATKASALIVGAVDELVSIDFDVAGSVAVGELFDALEATPTLLKVAMASIGVYAEIVTIAVTDGVSFIINIYSATDTPVSISTTVNGVTASTAFVLI